MLRFRNWLHYYYSSPSLGLVTNHTGRRPVLSRALAKVLLRWNMQRGVPVIPKASSAEHLRENIEGAFSWHLTAAQKVRARRRAWACWECRRPRVCACTLRPLGCCQDVQHLTFPVRSLRPCTQNALDELDCGLRFIAPTWKDWGNPEEGGVTKPSLVLA